VLIAILSHKLLIAFILSVQIYERCCQDVNDDPNVEIATSKSPTKSAKLILLIFGVLFSAMSPIGILIVIALDSANSADGEQQQLHIIVLAAISAGTIVYIVFLEIVDKASSRTYITGLVQWTALLVGFLLMAFIARALPE